jgi:DNA invertase Pin-like site-specific DNA recombinase
MALMGRPRKTRLPAPSGPLRVVAYARVSTREQGRKGVSLDAQRHAIETEAQHRGWSVVRHLEDVASGKSTNGRPGLEEAVAIIEGGEADALVATKLDRISRSVVDFGGLVERSRRKNWGLVVLDTDVDTTRANGELIANVVISIAQWERRIIGERTREALEEKRRSGTKLGRPEGSGFESISAQVVRRLRRMRARGMTFVAIANRLDADGVPTARGGKWRAGTVQRVLERSGTS